MLNFHPSLSIIEKQIKAISPLFTEGTNIYIYIYILSGLKLLFGSTHRASITTASGVRARSVNRQSYAEWSQVICRSYLSRWKGDREDAVWWVIGQEDGSEPGGACFGLKVGGWIYSKLLCRLGLCCIWFTCRRRPCKFCLRQYSTSDLTLMLASLWVPRVRGCLFCLSWMLLMWAQSSRQPNTYSHSAE